MTLLSRFLTLALLSTTAAVALAQEERQVTLLGGVNTRFLGSEDPREGFGIALSVLRSEPRASFGTFRGEVKYEANFLTSTSPGLFEYDADRTEGYGLLALYRISRYREGRGLYLEGGLGLQYSTQATHDARLQLNTTPTLGAGYRFLSGERAIELGARYYHVSNGGRKDPNGGQNWLFATLSFSF